ncbi:MAG: hypothetical protein GX868_01460 [Actinobacteria bacterium]|nr:hypothetical protein [Actinomycetota bacterium]
MSPSSLDPNRIAPGTRSPFGSGLEQFSPNDLEAVGRRFAELTFPLSSGWSNLIGVETTVTVAEVIAGPLPTLETLDPSTSATLLDLVAGEGAFRVIGTFGPDLDAIALVIGVPLGLVIVDRLLGGSGRQTEDRQFSTIDLDLLSAVIDPTFVAMSALRPAGQGHLSVGRMTEPSEAELNTRLSGGCTVCLSVAFGDQVLPMHLVLGQEATRELAGVRSQATHTTPLSKSESELSMQAALQQVNVEVVVCFEPVSVPSHRLMALDVGDVLPLRTSPDSPLPLFVDSKRFATVRPARSGTQVACKVVDTFSPVGDATASADLSSSHGGSL